MNHHWDPVKYTALLSCGDEKATAFLVADNLALSARHSILPHLLDSDEPIRLAFSGDLVVTACPSSIEIPEQHDAVLLEIDGPADPARIAPLIVSHLPKELKWNTSGYLASRGQRISAQGRVSDWSYADETPWDTVLSVDGFDNVSSYEGLSGSPVVVDGAVRGIIQKQLASGLGCTSLLKLRPYLAQAQIAFVSKSNLDGIPAALRPYLREAIPNGRTFWALEEAISSKKPSGYVVLNGPPGSGKTFVSAGFNPVSDSVRVLGRYFIGSEAHGHRLPDSYYARAESFAQWLGDCCSMFSRNAVVPPEGAPQSTVIEALNANLAVLADYCREVGITGVLIVDYADWGVTLNARHTLFLDEFPRQPPDGLSVLLVVSDKEGFSTRFPDLNVASCVSMAPMARADAENLVLREYREYVTPALAASLVQRSEGNPLILRFLIGEAKSRDSDVESPDDGQTNVSFVDVEHYYDRVWKRHAQTPETRWLLATAARLRGPLDTSSQLVVMQPESSRVTASAALLRIPHLLGDDGANVFHSSFRHYILAHTNDIDALVHDEMARLCREDGKSSYAMTNLLYHHLCGSASARAQAESLCTQEWLDDVARLGAAPFLILRDIGEVLRNCLDEGLFYESVRVLLLRSRARFRYESILIPAAASIAEIMVYLGKPRAALDFVLHDQRVVCEPEEAGSLLAKLLLAGEIAAADELYQSLRARWWTQYEAHTAGDLELSNHLEAAGIALHIDESASAIELQRLSRLLHHNLKRSPSGELEHRDALRRANMLAGSFAQKLWSFGAVPVLQRDLDDEPIAAALFVFMLARLEQLVNDLGPGAQMGELREPPEGLRLLNEVDLVEELARLCESSIVPTEVEEVALGVLLRYSTPAAGCPTFIRAKCPALSECSLRGDNGVDLNDSVGVLFQACRIKGFVGNDLPVVEFQTRHAWEINLLEATRKLGWAVGAGTGQGLSVFGEEAQSLIEWMEREIAPLLLFSLKKRAAWDDSYAIPEVILPFLFGQAARLIALQCPEAARRFVDHFLRPEDENEQAGLYTEGYRRCLGGVAHALSGVTESQDTAVYVLQHLARHISSVVFNRAERVLELLECGRLAGSLGATALVEDIFGKVLNSSMGPAWYKEDQFSLLTTALEGADDPAVTDSEWRGVVTSLELASGEATFQRYVRQEKEALLKHLAKSGLLREAVYLYLNYCLPSPLIQKQRIQSLPGDKTGALRGLRFGVREVDEQGGILALIPDLTSAHPCLVWALIELFLPGDDRYLDSFAREIGRLLKTESADLILARLIRMVRTDFPPSKRETYIRALLEVDTGELLRDSLASAGFGTFRTPGKKSDEQPEVVPALDRTGELINTEHEIGEIMMPGVFGSKRAIRRLDKAVRDGDRVRKEGNQLSAMDFYADGLKEAQTGGWFVWRNLGQGAETALRGLLSDVKTRSEGLKKLGVVVIAEQHASDWEIAETLMRFGLADRSEDGRSQAFGLVREHLRQVLAPEAARSQAENEGELVDVPDVPASEGDLIGTLIVAQLDHPNRYMRERAADILYWLGSLGEAAAFGCLVERVRDARPGFGREIAMGVLEALSTGRQEAVRDAAKYVGLIVDEEPNLLVRESLRGVFDDRPCCTEKGQSASSNEEPSAVNSGSNETTGTQFQWSPGFDAAFRSFGDDLRNRAEDELASLAGDRDPAEFLELWEIARLAYNARPVDLGTPLEREAILRALGTDFGEEARRIGEDLSLVNPLWPDAVLDGNQHRFCGEIIERCERREMDGCLEFGDEILIHAHELIVDEQEQLLEELEITAILVSRVYFDGNVDWGRLWDRHSLRGRQLGDRSASLIAPLNEPAVVRVEPGVFIGGNLTPALPSDRLKAELRLEEQSFRRLCWRDGRLWDPWGVGPPLSRGTALLVGSSHVASMLGADLAWVVKRNGAPVWIIDPNKRRIYTQADEY